MAVAPAPVNLRPRCPVCKSEYRSQYHVLRADGASLDVIREQTVKLGRPIKRETLGKHFRICWADRELLDGITSQSIADDTGNPQGQAERDFAILVQRRATEMLARGDLRVTASHGLAAQALLDRRAEKQADRDLTLNMARLLSGAIAMPPITVIEGRVVDVPALTDGLAPEGVYETSADTGGSRA